MGISVGRFLDIGAYDGKAFSNTLKLAELGWGGVCIEPSPSVFPALMKLHGQNPNIDLVNAAVSPSPSLVEFYDSGGDAISTTSAAHRDKWQRGWTVNFTKFFVFTLPMPVMFARFGYNYQFINIDVEATNWDIFEKLPFDLLSANRVICIEHDNYIDQMVSLAAPHGYRVAHTNGENLILAR